MARSTFRKQLPDHDFAADHKLLHAVKKYQRRLALAKEWRAPEEIAAERIRELMWDYGKELEWHRWMAHAWRQMSGRDSTCYKTLRDVAQGRVNRVGLKVVQQIAMHTGIPIGVFYDEEV